MSIMAKTKKIVAFSPSVNIIRDEEIYLNYIATSNTEQIFNQLINDYLTGIRSFNIVGAYGTGKSSFLWAFERHLKGEANYFSPLNKDLNQLHSFEFVKLVGEHDSLIGTFADLFDLNRKRDYKIKDILSAIDEYYQAFHSEGKGLVILIDEFGKFLEYVADNNPEAELYFIQQLAEYVNDKRRNIFLITTLHQDFNGYSRTLTKSQQNEWNKVKGRLREITFNEPVEQLLFLASERLSELNFGNKDKNFSMLFKAIESAKAFPLKDFFDQTYAEKVLPFDILSAAVLTLALQKYGQNERSLFSFIESNDPLGIRDFNSQKAPYYNISDVYDYLIHNFYSYLSTKNNTHYAQWSGIRTAAERVEGNFPGVVSDALKLVKTIGLLNIFASASIRLNSEFLEEYGTYALGIKDTGKILKSLEGLRIVRFIKHSNKYVFVEGTDLDIELAIDEAGNLVQQVSNVVHPLNQYFDFPYIPAKAIIYEKGTPRYFAFRLSDVPVNEHPEGEVDGYINLVFSDNLDDETQIISASADCEEAVLYGWYTNTAEIKNQIWEIEKIKKVKENNLEDKVAVRELDSILDHHVKLLNHYVKGKMYTEDSPVKWFFKGKEQRVKDQKSFNQLLSIICREVYSFTPEYLNEMVNKTKLSPPIATARKNFVRALVDHWPQEDLGFEATKFPPEKTIYLSLLDATGIHAVSEGGGYTFGPPSEESLFLPLWNACEEFIASTRNGKRNLQELTDLLLSRPFKMKQGFVDFWLPTFLFIKRDDFALFDGENAYIPFLTEETLDLLSRKPKDFSIKAFDIEGVKLDLFNRYRALLNQSKKETPSGPNFIETIRPFLTFYRQLPEYAKNTKRLNSKTLAVRETIKNSTDPEETFFKEFPEALGYTIPQLQKDQALLEVYVNDLQACIREIRTCHEELLNRVEAVLLLDIIGEKSEFSDYKIRLQKRFKRVKQHLLSLNQRVFHQRIMSGLDDRKSWLSSLAQACVGKSLDVINDAEEDQLRDRLKDLVHELDNLSELSKGDIDESKEFVFKLEVTSFVEGLKKNLVRLPKSKGKELAQLQGHIKATLSDDKQLNIATLTKLLEELLQK